MRKILLMVAVAALAGLAMFAQDKGDKGGGKAPKAKAPLKNLRIFTQENWATVGRPAMDMFVSSLGLADKGGCTYCHTLGQFDDDGKTPKVVARAMMGMVSEINAKFPDPSKTHVTCFTCHRGSTVPLTAPPAQ